MSVTRGGATLWAGAAAYEAYIGRWSRPVAALFVRWLDLAPNAAWLDFGCGTGALSQAILDHAKPRLVIGCDRSPQYVGHAAATITDSRAQFRAAEPAALPSVPGGFDAVVSGLVLNFLPDPAGALRAFRQIVAPGGAVAAYVWDYAEGMQLLRMFWNAVTALDPAARERDEATSAPAPLRQLFQGAGLGEVVMSQVTVPTRFASFEDYWTPFLGGQGPGGQYVVQLSPAQRARLEERLRAELPFERDGSLHLEARAWTVRGVAG